MCWARADVFARLSLGAKTADALRRYMRARRAHQYASSTALWLGRVGPLTR